MNLASFVRESAQQAPSARAVQGPGGKLTYRELDELADRVSHVFWELGVRPGDRVALWTEKSVQGVAVMQGILRMGGVYVPIDPLSPPLRARRIIADCDVRCVFTSSRRATVLLEGMPRDVSSTFRRLAVLGSDDRGAAGSLPSEVRNRPWVGWDEMLKMPATPLPAPAGGDHLAYILYTSGSTGTPKGVCLSHTNAIAFVDAMVRELGIGASDRLSNHAPFHFDLSVFDLYAAFRTGASVSIISETAGHAPRQLVELLHREQLTIWYSVPSALMLMMDRGGLRESPPPHSLRVVLFAGEVYPVKHLAALRRRLEGVRLLNLYGPTETNVCTFHEVSALDEDDAPISIGRACCGDRVWAQDEHGNEVPPGEIGELVVEGPTVMLGYWGQEPQRRPYATGDLVRRAKDGRYYFVGRRDHMVKVRGHRIELIEIEHALISHPGIQEAAVVAVGDNLDARLVAYVVPTGDRPPSLVSIKEHCAERLPPYMIVHEVRAIEGFPRTSTGKIDRRSLAVPEDAAAVAGRAE